MESSSPLSPSGKGLTIICSIVAMAVAVVAFNFFTRLQLESPPTRVRPWAEDRFQKLTAPVPSPGKPLDPQYQARNRGSRPGKNPNYVVTVDIEPATSDFIPNFEVVEFDAADGFKSRTGGGKVRWLAAKTCEVPPGKGDDPHRPGLTLFHANGTPMNEDEIATSGISKRELGSWGLEQEGEFGTALKGVLEINGFSNLQAELQDVLDASTHVSLSRHSHIDPIGSVNFNATLAVVHDARLIAVFDLAHGETQDFEIPVTKGQVVNHPDFHLEVIDVFAGSVCSGSTELRDPKGVIEQAYGIASSPSPTTAFSVIYQINPPSMALSLSVDAIDASGEPIKNHGSFMDHAPVSRFGAPLASATALRVRYRPLQTRLLMHMKSLPTVTPPNLKPTDLFDIEVPVVGFRDPFAMRRFIAESTQLKDVTGSFSYDTAAAFPIDLTRATPRQVAERYLALDSGRRLRVGPAALTIEFEPPKSRTWLTRITDWVKALPLSP